MSAVHDDTKRQRRCLCGCGDCASPRAAFIQFHHQRRWTFEVQTQAQVEALAALGVEVRERGRNGKPAVAPLRSPAA